jgi:hypothetical protein
MKLAFFMVRRETVLSCYRMIHWYHWPIIAFCPPLSKTRLWSQTNENTSNLFVALELSRNWLAVFSHPPCTKMPTFSWFLEREHWLIHGNVNEAVTPNEVHSQTRHTFIGILPPHGRRLSKIWNIVYCGTVNGSMATREGQNGIKTRACCSSD